ncbi:MAG: hypothetical protein DRK00_03570 [Thermoprotei archaeon]|nr:MAG: hypothetical protein DRK00_03570 [Thermoprotei archaeon]
MERWALIWAIPALLAAVAAAQIPTPLSLKVDGDLEVAAVYPLEVKYGSWARVVIEVRAFRNLTVNELRVKLVLVHERGRATLVDRIVLKNETMAAGERREVDVGFRATAPAAPLEPFIEMRLTLSYAVNEAAKHVEYRASIAVAPRQTYAELRRQLEEALEKASLVDELKDEVEELRLKLANESGRCSILSEQLEALKAEAASLREELASLRTEASLLRDMISRLEEENRKLRAENAALREERRGLSSRLASVQDSYELLAERLSELRGEYERLLAECTALKAGLAAATVLAVALAAALVYPWARRRLSRRGASAGERVTQSGGSSYDSDPPLLID